jgi:hypothetical protein
MNTFGMAKGLTKCGAVALTLGVALAAHADTLTYDAGITGTFDFGSTGLVLQQFDPSLGTLNSISISLSANTVTSLTVQNTSPSTYGSGSDVWNDVSVLLGSSAFDQAVNALNPNVGQFRTPGAWLDVASPYFNVSGLASGGNLGFLANNTGYSGQPALVTGVTSGFIFTALQGTGSQTLDVYSQSTVDSAIAEGATFDANETVTGGINAIVTYDYTPAPVPEPTTVALLGLGACSLIGAMRRRIA